MEDFTFYWNAPSSIWMRCGECRGLVEVDYGQTLQQLQVTIDAHVHETTDDEFQCCETTEHHQSWCLNK